MDDRAGSIPFDGDEHASVARAPADVTERDYPTHRRVILRIPVLDPGPEIVTPDRLATHRVDARHDARFTARSVRSRLFG